MHSKTELYIYDRPAQQMWTLYFAAVVSSFFPSPILSGHRLDVYHTY